MRTMNTDTIQNEEQAPAPDPETLARFREARLAREVRALRGMVTEQRSELDALVRRLDAVEVSASGDQRAVAPFPALTGALPTVPARPSVLPPLRWFPLRKTASNKVRTWESRNSGKMVLIKYTPTAITAGGVDFDTEYTLTGETWFMLKVHWDGSADAVTMEQDTEWPDGSQESDGSEATFYWPLWLVTWDATAGVIEELIPVCELPTIDVRS